MPAHNSIRQLALLNEQFEPLRTIAASILVDWHVDLLAPALLGQRCELHRHIRVPSGRIALGLAHSGRPAPVIQARWASRRSFSRFLAVPWREPLRQLCRCIQHTIPTYGIQIPRALRPANSSAAQEASGCRKGASRAPADVQPLRHATFAEYTIPWYGIR